MDMVDPQPTLVELLVRYVQLPREFLPQIGINSIVYKAKHIIDRLRCLIPTAIPIIAVAALNKWS
jgi:hypothetical protein